MTEVDREIGLALLKILLQRGLISEAEYTTASNSRFFDRTNFLRDTETEAINIVREVNSHDDNS